MKTTSLFVELIIIGIGFTIWNVLFAITILGYEWIPNLTISNGVLVFPVLALFYVIGIIWDRSIDYAINYFDKLIQRRFFVNSDSYHSAKDFIYSKTGSLTDLFEYTRSRMRICRSWMIDLFLIALIIPFFICQRTDLINQEKVAVFFVIFFLLLSLLCNYAWRNLTITYYERLLHSSQNTNL